MVKHTTLMTEPQWKKNLLNPEALIDVNTLSETVELVFEILTNEGPTGIDLNNLEARKINPIHLATILRATCSWEEIVPGWQSALNVAKESLLLNDMDPYDALCGLIPKKEV